MAAERIKNAQTWKQVSTNVPPEMYKQLRSRVTKEKKNMSQLLREMLTDSLLISAGGKSVQPSWSYDLALNLAALRQEITAGKPIREDLVPELQKEIVVLKNELLCMSQQLAQIKPKQNIEKQEANELCLPDPLLSLFDAKQEELAFPQSVPAKEKAPLWPIIGRLTEMFGARGTA